MSINQRRRRMTGRQLCRRATDSRVPVPLVAQFRLLTDLRMGPAFRSHDRRLGESKSRDPEGLWLRYLEPCMGRQDVERGALGLRGLDWVTIEVLSADHP